MAKRLPGPWPSTFDQPQEAAQAMHPTYAARLRHSIVGLAIEQSTGMSDEEIFDIPPPDRQTT